MKELNIIFSGFGGQGILFAAKVLAYAGLICEKQVSWLPSYGPEMRGGTANCSVTISESEIGSPLITAPNVLLAMNAPSVQKFINYVVPGGTVIVDSSLVLEKIERNDINIHYISATNLAEENEISGLANIIMVGKFLKVLPFCDENVIDMAIEKCVPKSKEKFIELNKKAVKIGAKY